MAKRERKTYTPQKRAQVLAVAEKQGLSATKVQERFGVKPVTYYLWRKKAGLTRRPSRRTASGAANGTSTSALRADLRARVRAVLPGIVRSEVAAYLKHALGRSTRRSRR